MRIIDATINRPVTTLMAYVAVIVLGIVAMRRLPLDFLPNVDFPRIFVSIPHPNSSPLQVEKEITKPIEEALSTLSGIKRIRSTSSADESEVSLEFNWGESLEAVRMHVGEKIEEVRATLPASVENIFIFSASTSDIPVVEARVAAPGVDLSRNYDLLELRVKRPIQRLPGVARVELQGVEPKEVRIHLRLEKMREHQLDVGALIASLQQVNRNLSLGKIDQNGQVYHLRSLGGVEDYRALEDFPVPGTSLKLGDVARITYSEPVVDVGRHLEKQYAVALSVYKESTANTVDVARRVTNLINNELNHDETLQGINLFVFQDQAKEILNGVHGIQSSGIVGAILATIVLFFFLRRYDATLIVALAIPSSILAAMLVLYATGKTLNVLTMMGLMLGVGMLVDNSIVVLESIFRHYAMGKNALVAARDGANEVGTAVVASSLTSVIVFVPLAVGVKSELFVWLGQIGLTISLTLLCSLVVAVTLIPLLGAKILHLTPPSEPHWITRMRDAYANVIRFTLRHHFITAAGTLVLLASVAIPFMMGLSTAPFSARKNDRMYIGYDFLDFHYKEDSEAKISRVEDYLIGHKKDFGLKSVYSYFRENEGGTVLVFDRENYSDAEFTDLRKKIRSGMPKLPGVKARFDDEQAELGGKTTEISVNLYGQDSDYLERIGRDVEHSFERIGGMQDVKLSSDRARKEVRARLNTDLAYGYGLTPADVSQIFAFCLGGYRLPRLRTEDREVAMLLDVDPNDVTSMDDVRKLTITANGRPVQLSALADFTVEPSALQIRHLNRKTTLEVAGMYEGDKPKEAKQKVEDLMKALRLPPGYSWAFGEQVRETEEQNKQMLENLVLALILVYFVMSSLFESLIHPFAMLFAVPFAAIGAIWFLFLTKTPFNIMSQIGLLILIGIVVNNGIVLIDHVNRKRREGMSREEAIVAGGRERLRPILMTALTTICGLIPLAFGRSGTGGLYYFPLARTVMGGLAASTFLTLMVLPQIYVLFDSLGSWARRVWTRASA